MDTRSLKQYIYEHNLIELILQNIGCQYIKYHLGADSTESIVISQILAQKKYDGIIENVNIVDNKVKVDGKIFVKGGK